MKFLSLEEFQDLFKSANDLVSYPDFKKNAVVVVGNTSTPLTIYMDKKNITENDIQLLFENIRNKNDYLSRFYTLSLRTPLDRIHFHNIIEPMPVSRMDNNQKTVYKNLIRNIHYNQILHNTTSGLENNRSYLNMLFDLYKEHKIDYKILTPSAIFYMKENRLGSVFSSYYFRASIMNPFLVYSLNQSLLHGTKVFTPTLGWSSYAYGLLECPTVTEYVGTDVIPDVCKKTEYLIASLRENIKHEILCVPSENLLKSDVFKSKYKNHFDLVFFSPPYYRLELYEGDHQSTTLYKTYDEWLSKYWEETIKLAHYVLCNGGKLCYIISGYGSKNTKRVYDLITDLNAITIKYFANLECNIPMHNKDVHVTKHKETSERIIVFTK